MLIHIKAILCLLLHIHHLTRSAQYAALILPLAMFSACLALNDSRRALSALDSPSRFGDPDTPCWPKRIVLIWSPSLATTTWLLVGCEGVRFGLLKPSTPTRSSRGSFLAAMVMRCDTSCLWIARSACGRSPRQPGWSERRRRLLRRSVPA